DSGFEQCLAGCVLRPAFDLVAPALGRQPHMKANFIRAERDQSHQKRVPRMSQLRRKTIRRSATKGERSSPPRGGMTRRMGAKRGSVNACSARSTMRANWL